MSEKPALILFTIGGMFLQVLVIGVLHGLGASSETIASTTVLQLCAMGLVGGLIFMRYH
jgi:predicted lysophospholipase L1 biosynthesis ABC-type transport system permease subunit